jgi:hypothetical protein
MSNKIPEIVEIIIGEYQEARLIENEKKQQEEQRKTEERNVKGKAIADEWIEKAFLSIPEWLRQYYCSEATSLDYYRIVQGWESSRDLTLTFKIPGLAQIQYQDGQWRSEQCGWNRGYEDSEPYIHFGRDSYWQSSLEATLVYAKSEMEEHQSNLTEYAAEQERLAKRATEEAQMDNQIEQKIKKEKEEQKAAEQAEEEALLLSIKNDPVAIHMLKAFILLRDERSTFEQHLDELGEEMYSIENHWSRKAADLRRQADEAKRHARDEQSRLQSDLDDAEAKLKKSKRGW